MTKISKEQLDHPVAWVSGVTAEDTRLSAARKAIDTMKLAGFSKRAINKAERMYADAVARGVT